MKKLYILCFTILSIPVFAQTDLFKDFGSPTFVETQMKDCSFDPGASAIYLRKDAVTIPDNQRMIVYYRNRIKILKSKGTDLANIQISVYSLNEWETVSEIKAVSINYDNRGNKIMTPIDPKNIYRTKKDNYYSTITFSMPEVREGTIIEYRYTSYRKSYKIIDYWYFQDEIPVLSSTYDYTILPGAQFSYRVLKSSSYQVSLKEFKGEGRLLFEMSNMAGITDEPYMDAKRDYQSRLELQMNYSGSGIDRERFVGTWPELTRQLLSDEDFGQQIDRSIGGTDEIVRKAKTISDEKARVEYLFNEVQRRMTWNNYIGIYAGNRLKSVWEKRTGSAAEINLILINLLQAAEIHASPLLVSDRFHGKVNMSHPFISQFSKVIAYTQAGDKIYYLDASQRGNGFNLIPESLLNTNGYLVDRKKSQFVTVSDPMHYDKRTINITGKIDPDGMVKGQAYIIDRDYARSEKENQYRVDKNQFIHTHFEEPFSMMKVDSMTLENLENDTLPLNQMVNFTHQLAQSGDYKMLYFNLFSGIEKNPFIADNRNTQINFGCNRSLKFNENFEIDNELMAETLPKDIHLIMPDTSISVKRFIQLGPGGKNIIVRIMLDVNKSVFDPEDYPAVKEFFKKLYDILDEPVVLIRKSS